MLVRRVVRERTALALSPFYLSQLVVEVALDLRPILRAELDGPVELYHPVFRRRR